MLQKKEEAVGFAIWLFFFLRTDPWKNKTTRNRTWAKNMAKASTRTPCSNASWRRSWTPAWQNGSRKCVTIFVKNGGKTRPKLALRSDKSSTTSMLGSPSPFGKPNWIATTDKEHGSMAQKWTTNEPTKNRQLVNHIHWNLMTEDSKWTTFWNKHDIYKWKPSTRNQKKRKFWVCELFPLLLQADPEKKIRPKYPLSRLSAFGRCGLFSSSIFLEKMTGEKTQRKQLARPNICQNPVHFCCLGWPLSVSPLLPPGGASSMHSMRSRQMYHI